MPTAPATPEQVAEIREVIARYDAEIRALRVELENVRTERNRAGLEARRELLGAVREQRQRAEAAEAEIERLKTTHPDRLIPEGGFVDVDLPLDTPEELQERRNYARDFGLDRPPLYPPAPFMPDAASDL